MKTDDQELIEALRELIQKHNPRLRSSKNMARALIALEKQEGNTSLEISHNTGVDRHLLGRRLPDARNNGLVQEKQKRHCKQSPVNMLSKTWGFTFVGKSMLKQAKEATGVN